jgi:hypothetical protein
MKTIETNSNSSSQASVYLKEPQGHPGTDLSERNSAAAELC